MTPEEFGKELINEVEAETEEQNRRDVLKEITESSQLQHPIKYDVYDLCNMNNWNKLQVFNVSMMKTICMDFEISFEKNSTDDM